MKRVLILGGSYTGRYLARNFTTVSVTFLSRNSGDLMRDGLPAFADEAQLNLSDFDLLVDCIPFVKENFHPYEKTLTKAPQLNVAAVHLSSTSVFPDNFQAETESDLPSFDEASLPEPEADRGKRRLHLERTFTSLVPQGKILRCGGIYGPGRSLPERVQSGRLDRLEDTNKIVSRIHVYDLCQLILAITLCDHALVHAVDEKSTLNAEVYSHTGRLLGKEIPGTWKDQRPSGRKIRSLYTSQLIKFRFPTYVEGFADILSAL